MPKTNANYRTVTIQQCLRCKEEACEVYLPAHEQADDTADGVLLDSYTFRLLDKSITKGKF